MQETEDKGVGSGAQLGRVGPFLRGPPAASQSHLISQADSSPSEGWETQIAKEPLKNKDLFQYTEFLSY